MTNENYTIQVLAVVNGKNTKGTLTLSLDKYEFNGTQQPINWEKASCTKGTTKVKSFIFSSEKPHVAICTPDHRSPAFVMEQAQINEFVAKVAELGERVKQIRIAEEAERESKIAAENAALKAAQEELVRKQAFEEKMRREEEERKRLEAEEKARHQEEERKRLEAEEKARHEAEERKRLEAEEKARREEEERKRLEAEEKARREEERKRLEAEEKARYEEEESKRTKIEMQQKEIAKKAGEKSMGKTISSKIPDGVLYAPGAEPAAIKNRIDRLFEKLDGAYPDKVVIGLHKDHKKWGETVTELYRQLGYPDGKAFLTAYGYSVGTGASGRPSSVDPDAIIAQLKKLYPEGTSMSFGDLQKAHPDIPWKSLQNKSNEYFGMTLTKYLAKEGILTSGRAIGPSGISDEKKATELVETLKKRYEGKDKPKELKTLIADNPDLPISSLNKVVSKLFGTTTAAYLTQNGVLQSSKGVSDEDKLVAIEKALLERYKGKEELPENVAQIKQENKDLKLSGIEALVNKVKGVPAKEYFTTLGILPVEKTAEEKLEEIISALKERYIGTSKKAYTISDLSTQNPDLAISSLKKLIKEVHDKTQTEYLSSLGILSEYDWQVAAKLEEERVNAQKAAQREKFKNDLPFEEMYRMYLESFKKQTVENHFFDINIPERAEKDKNSRNSDYRVGETTETTPDGFVINRGVSYGKPYVELHKYNGNAEVVEVPDYVTTIWHMSTFANDNIKKIILPEKVTGVNLRAFSENVRKNIADKDGLCIVGRFLVDYLGNAKSVTIPEGVEEITFCAFARNTSITAVYLPKSIKVIGNQAFAGCDHLAEVVFNSETEELDCIDYSAFGGCSALKKINLPKYINKLGDGAFNGCNIPTSNAGFEVVNNILVRYSGNDTIVNVPKGITVIGPHAFHGEQIKKIMLPEGVKTICNRAFNGLKSLSEVSIPESLETIESSAFSFCDKLLSVNLSGVTNIGAEAFQHCSSLKDVVLSERLESIESGVFSSCRALKSIGVKGSHGMIESVLPEELKVLSSSAFAECESLREITIPGSVQKIGVRAFYGCKSLTKAILQEGIEEIGEEAFENTTSMVSINIPSSVSNIGKDAFFRCNCSKEIAFPEIFCENKGYYGIPDDNNCFVENGILIRYASGKETVAQITDGVVVLEEGSLNGVFGGWGSSGVSQIILPDSVRVIRHENYGYSPKFKMNIPCGYLLQKRKLPIEPLKTLLNSVWKYAASMMDWVSIFIYQNSKQLYEYCTEAFAKAPNAFVTSALVTLGDKCKPSDVDRIGEAVFDLRKDIGQEFLDKFFAFAKEHKSKKAVSALAPFVSSSVGGELNAKKEYKNDIEEFCDKNYEKHEFERIMQKAGLNGKAFEKSGVKYSDRDEEVSSFVLECAILPYVGQLTEKPRNIGSYKTYYSTFSILENSDMIASKFEKASFETFIDNISKKAGGYDKPQIWIPVCRFGTGDQVKALISSMNGWTDWYSCGSSGRMGIMVCRGAIMLSDSREAMMYAEKCKCLDYYARLRGMTADTIRDTKLADFGFNGDGKKIYDLGNTVIEASVGDDLTIILFDTTASKIVKSLPKKGSDTAKYDACSADYSELKKNVKKVVKTRNDLLFEYFLSGKKFDCASWTTAYTENPVLKKVAKLLVWAQGKQTFTLNDTGAIDSFGNAFVINPAEKIVVAHPLEMEDADIARWQKYFTELGLKQPFEQIWEPKIKGEIRDNRYTGCMIPYYRFLHQEKHGITVEDYDFHNQIEIEFQGCNASIERIDWARHSIDVKDRFEIKSFSVRSLNRRTNHIIYYLDKCTIFGRIEQDDDSSLQNLECYTVAQIDSFLKFAIEKGSTKCTAAFLNYKNEHFADFADIEEFTLDF